MDQLTGDESATEGLEICPRSPANEALWVYSSGSTSRPKEIAHTHRSTDATVFSVAEGSGCSKVGNTVIDWQRRDMFVVPGWMQVRHYPSEDSFLFSFSNCPVQEKLGLWRELRGKS